MSFYIANSYLPYLRKQTYTITGSEQVGIFNHILPKINSYVLTP